MIKKVFITSFLIILINGCATDCHIYPTLKMCTPSNLDSIYPKQKMQDEKYYSTLKKIDRKERRFSKVNKQLSVLWNEIIQKASISYMNKQKLIEEVSRDNFKYPFEVTVYSKDNISTKPNKENIKYMLRKQGVPENILQNQDFDNFKGINMGKILTFFIEGTLYTQHFNNFYKDNNKNVFVTKKKIPFVKRTGNVFIPKKYIDTMSEEEIYMILSHEANHLYDSKMISWNAHISAFQNKIIKEFPKSDVNFNQMKGILNISLHNNIDKEIAVDMDVLAMFSDDKNKRYQYQKVIEKVIPKSSKEYTKRLKIIKRFNKFLDSYSIENFFKTYLLKALSSVPAHKASLIKNPKIYIDKKIQNEYADIFRIHENIK